MIFLLCELFRGFEDATFLASSNYKKDRPNIEKLRPEEKKTIQWGSEIRPFEIREHLEFGLFEGRISNGWALAMAIAIVPTI